MKKECSSRSLPFSAAAGGVVFVARPPCGTHHYDAAGRLVRATGNGKVISYAYDSAGNGTRLTITGFGTGDLSYGGPLTLKEAILLLQVAAGMKPDLSSVNVLAEISGDGRRGREEALYILQTLAGQR
jgi:YD repeat-containing protein